MPFAGVSESTGAVVGRVATHLAPIEGVQQHANNQGDSNHDDRDARDAVRMFGDRHPVYAPQQEAADESDQDDVDDEIYECVHGDLAACELSLDPPHSDPCRHLA